MPPIMFKYLKLKMEVPGNIHNPDSPKWIGTLVWANKIKDDIYEVSFWIEDLGGYFMYYCKAKKEGGFELIESSLVRSEVADALRVLSQN